MWSSDKGWGAAWRSFGSLRKLRKATKKNPRDAVAWYQLGVAAMQEGETQEGQEALRIALALGPPGDVALALGQVFEELGRSGESLRAFRRAAEQSPESADARTGFGLALFRVGDREWGLEQLRKAAQLSAQAEPHFLLATHLLKAGHREEAQENLRRCINIEPTHQRAMALLGRCRREDGQLDEARGILERALTLDPADLNARLDLGVTLAKGGDKDGAYACFREVLERSERSPAMLVQVGLATHEMGDLTAAIRYLRDAVRIKPDLVEGHTQLGLLLIEEGSLGAATVALARAVELAPTSRIALFNLGVAYQRYGDLDEAERALTQAHVIAPDDLEISAKLREVQAAQAVRMSQEMPPVVAPSPQATGPLPAIPALTGPLPLVEAAPEPAGPKQPRGAAKNAAMVGSLDDFSLPDLLQLLKAARRSGVLYLSAGPLSGEVMIIEGGIVYGSSPSASLGGILTGRHHITEDQLRQAVAAQREGDPQLIGSMLVQQGLLTAEALAEALRTQIETAVGEMLGWNQGRFAFEPLKTAPDPQLASAARVEVDRVLMDVFQAQAGPE